MQLGNGQSQNNGVNPAAFKELLCVTRSILDMKNLGLKLEPTGNANKPWERVCLSDSHNGGDPVSRRSVDGFILNVFGALVSWQQKPQKV